MKKYTVIFDDGYYMEIMCDNWVRNSDGSASFVRGTTIVSSVPAPKAVIDSTQPDSYWFRHL